MYSKKRYGKSSRCSKGRKIINTTYVYEASRHMINVMFLPMHYVSVIDFFRERDALTPELSELLNSVRSSTVSDSGSHIYFEATVNLSKYAIKMVVEEAIIFSYEKWLSEKTDKAITACIFLRILKYVFLNSISTHNYYPDGSDSFTTD